MLIAFSSTPTFTVRLPIGDEITSVVRSVILVRDKFYSVKEANLTEVLVKSDLSVIDQLMEDFQAPSRMTNSWIQLLSTENQNTVGQLLTSFSQMLSQINAQLINETISSQNNYQYLSVHILLHSI